MILLFIKSVCNYKKVGIDIPAFWKSIFRILPGMIIPIVYGVFINCFININSYWNLLFVILGFVLVYFLSCWFFSMNHYEKDIFSKPLKRFLKK